MAFAGAQLRSAGRLRGVLAGRGEAMVRLYVYPRPLPHVVPEAWRDLAQPVLDRAGNLVDWRFSYPYGDLPDDTRVEDLRYRFRRWRSGFVIDRVAGDAATVTAFVACAEHHSDVGLLHVLRLDEGRIRTHDLSRAAWQAGRAVAAMSASGEIGLGVFAADRGRLVRGFATGRSAVTIVADDATALTATTDSVVVDQRPADSTHGGRTVLRGWRHADGETLVLTDGGWVPLLDPHAAGMLAAVAPGVAHVRTAPVALSRMFAGLVVSVADMAGVAAAANAELISRTGPAM